MPPPTLQEQIEFQRAFRDLVQANTQFWPREELEYAKAILESLERLHGLENRR
jgi:hypothetical protein